MLAVYRRRQTWCSCLLFSDLHSTTLNLKADGENEPPFRSGACMLQFRRIETRSWLRDAPFTDNKDENYTSVSLCTLDNEIRRVFSQFRTYGAQRKYLHIKVPKQLWYGSRIKKKITTQLVGIVNHKQWPLVICEIFLSCYFSLRFVINIFKVNAASASCLLPSMDGVLWFTLGFHYHSFTASQQN